jgi:hypothetical protein
VYLFAVLTGAAVIGWTLWLACVRTENLPDDVASFLEARRPVAAGLVLLGVLSLACALAGLAWGGPLRWWEYLIADAAVLCGAMGALVIVAAPMRS